MTLYTTHCRRTPGHEGPNVADDRAIRAHAHHTHNTAGEQRRHGRFSTITFSRGRWLWRSERGRSCSSPGEVCDVSPSHPRYEDELAATTSPVVTDTVIGQRDASCFGSAFLVISNRCQPRLITVAIRCSHQQLHIPGSRPRSTQSSEATNQRHGCKYPECFNFRRHRASSRERAAIKAASNTESNRPRRREQWQTQVQSKQHRGKVLEAFCQTSWP